MTDERDIPTAVVYSTWTEDGGKVLSMKETPPLVWGGARPDERDLLKRYGYRLLQEDPSRRSALFVRSWWRWVLNRPGVIASSAAWAAVFFLYRHPLIGVRKDTPAGVSIRYRDLRPFPFGHRVRSY